mmetsp:Transcript_2173/g.7203  ORF Transcript_2173/g.7203 Transcript_2173/m.7203 type:complete len:200 (+) Transcript_2173:711-1310(+)
MTRLSANPTEILGPHMALMLVATTAQVAFLATRLAGLNARSRAPRGCDHRARRDAPFDHANRPPRVRRERAAGVLKSIVHLRLSLPFSCALQSRHTERNSTVRSGRGLNGGCLFPRQECLAALRLALNQRCCLHRSRFSPCVHSPARSRHQTVANPNNLYTLHPRRRLRACRRGQLHTTLALNHRSLASEPYSSSLQGQ